MGAEELLESFRNCEWLKMFWFAIEFYGSTHNFLGIEGFSGPAENFFGVLREFVHSRIFGLIENIFCIEKFIFSDECLR